MNRSKKLLLTPVFLIGLGFGSAFAGFIQSNAKVGGYFLKAEEAQEKKPVYHYESFLVSGEAGELDFGAAFRQSNLYQTRQNTYNNSHRLSMAKVGYSALTKKLRVQGGRDYTSFIDRNILYDGGQVSLKVPKKVGVDVMSGWVLPNFYQENFFDFSQDSWFLGYQAHYRFGLGSRIYTDGTVQSEERNVFGLGFTKNFHRKLFLDANSTFDQEQGAINHVESSIKWRPRQHDRVQFLFAYEDDDIDSTQYLVNLYQESHIQVAGGYLYSFHPEGFLSIHQGILSFEDFLGYISYLGFGYKGFALNASQRIESDIQSFDQSVGYGFDLLNNLNINLGSGLLVYQLKVDDKTKLAHFSEIGLNYELVKGLKLLAEYQFLMNDVYRADNRLFIGISYKGYQRF